MNAGCFAATAPAIFAIGVNVILIIPGTKRPPAGVCWQPWQDRRQTPDELTHLVAAHGAADIAIITGAVSNSVVIDVDDVDGEAALRESKLPLPRTAMYASWRGINRVYRTSISLPSRLGFRPHLDILADRHFAVMPPSGVREWLTPGGLAAADELPQSWIDAITDKTTPLLTSTAAAITGVTGPALAALEHSGVAEGLRNSTLAALVGRWLTRRATEPELRRQALEWARRCSPPLPDDEALQVVASVLRTRQRALPPECAALLLARSRDVRGPAVSVLFGLITAWHQLGRPEPFYAPHRLVASYAGVSFDGVRSSLETLVRAGLIEASRGRDPWGRPTTIVKFRVRLAGTGSAGA